MDNPLFSTAAARGGGTDGRYALRKIIVGGIAVSLGLATAAAGGALAAAGDNQPVAWVNGGGQLLTDSTTNAGDTIAFNAQQLADGSGRGQFQYVQRSSGGAATHGAVDCVTVDSANRHATFAGVITQGADQGKFFRVDVTDNGTPPEGTDIITVSIGTDDDSCTLNDNSKDAPNLGRGNVTIHPQD